MRCSCSHSTFFKRLDRPRTRTVCLSSYRMGSRPTVTRRQLHRTLPNTVWILPPSTLTSRDDLSQKRLYYEPLAIWNAGQRQTLFHMACTVSALQHPVPVLVSLGWQILSACAARLFTVVKTVAALDEFCALLLSAASRREAWVVVGRVQWDAFVDNSCVKIHKRPSDTRPTCRRATRMPQLPSCTRRCCRSSVAWADTL